MATIYNVAKAAGVSSNTAARILRGLGGRAPNVTRVMQAAEKLGYVRNTQAAALRSGRTNLIGVILPSLVSTGYTTLFQHLHDHLTPHGYHVQAYCSRGRVADEAAALASLERIRPEGVYLDAAEGESDEACDAAIERLTKQGVRVVLAGRAPRKLKVDVVGYRNREAMAKAVGHLKKLGRTKLVFLGHKNVAAIAGERYTGFVAALKANGLSLLSEASVPGFDFEDGYARVRRLWDEGLIPDGLVCLNDRLAIGALRALADLKVPVPHQVAVVGLGDIPVNSYTVPRLTSLCPPYLRIASDITALFLEQRTGRGARAPRASLFYDLELIVREST